MGAAQSPVESAHPLGLDADVARRKPSAPAPTIEIVSPEFPCGAAWLANALIELSVPLPNLWGFDTAREWRDNGDGTSTYAAEDLPWRQTLAALRVGRTFHFDRTVRPRFSHQWPSDCASAKPVILIVRDPRDALYSEWRRHQRNLHLDPAVSFPAFVATPFFTASVSVIDRLRLFLDAWASARALSPEHFLVLRFEAWKIDPAAALERVVRFVGLDRTAEAIAAAAAASDIEILRQVEASVAASDPSARQFNRKGRANEWKDAWEPGWFKVFDDRWTRLFEAFGYEAFRG